MDRYFARYLGRHLDGLHLAAWGRPDPGPHAGPLVAYCNHPSWWDAITLFLLSRRLYRERDSYAPFDARMLARYGIFRKLGCFPVEADTRLGARQFLDASRSVLSRPGGMLWVTAQGRFADVRERPLGLAAGIAHLPDLAPETRFLPLALEYAFWDERGAAAFCAFGSPIPAGDLLPLGRSARLGRLEDALAATLSRLNEDVVSREAGRFMPVLSGEKGTGGIYGGWKRLDAALRGRRFDPAHASATKVRKSEEA